MVKPMFKSVLLVAGLSTFLMAFGVADSQEYSQLKTLKGYTPSVLKSKEQAQEIYNLLPTTIFKGRSGCFQRAHNWAYDLNRRYGLNSMKVFMFFTHRYQREFGYEWFYHVAPVFPVKVKQVDGSEKIEEMVFDPTFTSAPAGSRYVDNYDNGPVTVKQWTKYFIYPELDCPVVENYQDFENFQEQYYCYLVKTPMYTYIPEDIEKETTVRNHWNPDNLKNMKLAIPASDRN